MQRVIKLSLTKKIQDVHIKKLPIYLHLGQSMTKDQITRKQLKSLIDSMINKINFTSEGNYRDKYIHLSTNCLL